MAMRFCEVTIVNSGKGKIEWVADNLFHGEWQDGRGPSQSARVILPGEAKTFGSENGGDIPIIGSWGTGTQGVGTLQDDGRAKHRQCRRSLRPLHLEHSVPLLQRQWCGPLGAANHVRPAQTPGSGQFDDRDKSDPPLRMVLRNLNTADFGGDSWEDAYPYLIVPPLTIAAGRAGAIATYDFINTAEPNSSVFPSFGESAPRPKAFPEPIVNTDASMWT